MKTEEKELTKKKLIRISAVLGGTGLILLIAGFILVVMIAFIGVIWANQERVVFQPPGDVAIDAPTRVRYAAEDGQPLLGYVIGDRDRASHVLVAFHGNAEVAAHSLEWAEEVARRTGWLVLLAEYRGYAGLPGVPSYEGSRLDARSTVRGSASSSPSRSLRMFVSRCCSWCANGNRTKASPSHSLRQ